MEIENFTDFGEFADRVLAEEIKNGRQTGKSLHHQLMQITKAIGEAVTKGEEPLVNGEKIDYDAFKRFERFELAYWKRVASFPEHDMAAIAIEILSLIAERGIKIGDLDNYTLNMAPACFVKGCEDMSLNDYLYDLLGSILHRTEKEAETLSIIKMWEKNPTDEELEAILEETFGQIEEPEDIDIRTSYGYENYILQMRLMAALNAIASWFKSRGGKGMVWFVNAFLYIKAERGSDAFNA